MRLKIMSCVVMVSMVFIGAFLSTHLMVEATERVQATITLPHRIDLSNPRVIEEQGLTGQLAFHARNSYGSGIYLMRANGDSPKLYLQKNAAIQGDYYLLGISTNGQMLGIASHVATTTAWLVDTLRPPEATFNIQFPPLQTMEFRVSDIYVFTSIVYNTKSGISIKNLITGENSAVTIVKPNESGCDCSPHWSADYKSIFYIKTRKQSDGTTTNQIIQKSLATYDEEIIGPAATDYLVVSPDGKALAFVEDHYLIQFDLVSHKRNIIPVDGSLSLWLGYPAYSPDGRYLAYLAGIEASRKHAGDVYLVELASGKTSKWIEGEILSFYWSRNAD